MHPDTTYKFPLKKGWEGNRDLHPSSQSSVLLLPPSIFLLKQASFFVLLLTPLLFHFPSVSALTFKDSHFTNDYETSSLVKEGPVLTRLILS